MTINELIAFAKANNIDFDTELMLASEDYCNPPVYWLGEIVYEDDGCAVRTDNLSEDYAAAIEDLPRTKVILMDDGR